MFTGLVEDVGTIEDVQPEGSGLRLTVRTALPVDAIAVGDSIAVDGVCLTAERLGAGRFVVVAGRETLERSTIRTARPGRRVHLERARRLGDRLDGHLVQGHVDGVGRVLEARSHRESFVVWLQLPPRLARYVADKGSIAVDGVSLTVNELHTDRFRVNIVPHTARVTRLGSYRPGMEVNIEVDVLAKYVARLLEVERRPDLLQKLRESGF